MQWSMSYKRNKKTRKLYYLREPHGVQTKLKLTIIGVAVNPLILVPHGTKDKISNQDNIVKYKHGQFFPLGIGRWTSIITPGTRPYYKFIT